jgi:hypothetical protein
VTEVTKSSGNVFADIGLDPEAKALEIHNKYVRGDAHTVGLIKAIADAIRAERERCAYIAEIHTGLWDHATALNIAASIRNPDHVA